MASAFLFPRTASSASSSLTSRSSRRIRNQFSSFSTASLQAPPTKFSPVSSSTVNFKECEDDSFSLHRGLRIQAGLVIDRLPITFTEPGYREKWRNFHEDWLAKTKNGLQIDDSITYMRFPFHFLETEDELKAKAKAQAEGRDENDSLSNMMDSSLDDDEMEKSDLDKLLGDTGLDFDMSTFRKKGGGTKKKKAVASGVVEDDSLQSMTKSPEDFLWLYKGTEKYTFPRINRAPNDTMRDTLESLCERQLGESFSPHFVGHCPFAHDEIKNERKVFYYRAHVSTESDSGKIELPEDSPIADYAWIESWRLREFLSQRMFRTCRPAFM